MSLSQDFKTVDWFWVFGLPSLQGPDFPNMQGQNFVISDHIKMSQVRQNTGSQNANDKWIH